MTLVILYSKGGLGDVGRHAVQAALENNENSEIRVLAQHPETLDEKNWNCGCPEEHVFTDEQRKHIQIHKVESWEKDDLSIRFQGATAVISCLGNRQLFIGDRVAAKGSEAVIAAMKANNVSRVVAMSSVGIGDDWPPMELNWSGKLLVFVFRTLGYRELHDLAHAEELYRSSDLDYLLVRPVGLGEDVKPVGKWWLQKQEQKDIVGFNMAKIDCARFMVEEALKPTLHKMAIVVGAEPPKEADEERNQQTKNQLKQASK
jgi:hypothetical protein